MQKDAHLLTVVELYFIVQFQQAFFLERMQCVANDLHWK